MPRDEERSDAGAGDAGAGPRDAEAHDHDSEAGDRDDEPSGAPAAAEPVGAPWTRSVAWANALRALTILVFAAVVFLAVRLVTTGDEKPFYEHPRFGPGELPVFDAIALETDDELLIRGFVYEGPGFRELRLCNARTREDPPDCLGPFVSLQGVNRGNFALEEATVDEGTVYYSPDDVLVKGSLVGTLMRVTLVLGTDG